MRRGPCSILALLLIFLLVGSIPALARKSSSSFSSGGRTSSRSSGWSSSTSGSKSSGWSSSTPSNKSSSPSGWGSSSQPAPRSTPAAPSGGWSNSTGTRAPSSGESTVRPRSSFSTSGQSAIRKESSLKAYNAYQSRFAKPDNPVRSAPEQPAPAPGRTWDNYRDYRDYRDTYYSGRGWSAPGYAYQSSPSFGLWDAMFLWFMLRQVSGPTFMYNHQDDPGVKAFRQEADRLAADNADLKKQLSDLDAKVDQMRRDGVTPDPKAMPAGVDPSVALAADKVVKEKPESGGGIGTWLLIACAGFGVAAVFLLAQRRRLG